ncbi:MAG TPA: hypothetical protein VNO32_47235, partial [Candidatus Acidoferrum sp.]|nr:hypothetical protein [Candidatus Acidoferrum sp.]
TACTNAGASNLLFHDLRRSAVRNLDRAHVSRDVAMSITGHRTQSMFSRYNIVATDDVANALKQVVSIVSGS